MSNFHYKHFQPWEKLKLERLVNKQPICKPVYGQSNEGWAIIGYKWLLSISNLSLALSKHRETIKNELLRGSYWTLVNTCKQKPTTYSYSKDASDQHHLRMINKRRIQNTKILMNKKLKDFVVSHIHNQSLKSISGRTKIAKSQGLIETTISHTTLYNCISNIHVDFINSKCLKRTRKQRYRLRYGGKRQNGVSINERPININERNEFGHWEIDLIEGKRGTKQNLLTLCERKTRKGLAMKINGKESKTITNTLRMLQSKERLIYGTNIKSITTDNGSEFWDWPTFQKSIHNTRDDIDVWFTNPYCSWEKGSVENFNGLIRRKFPKGTDFTNVSSNEIETTIEEINDIFRPSLNYLTANEMYNLCVQFKC